MESKTKSAKYNTNLGNWGKFLNDEKSVTSRSSRRSARLSDKKNEEEDDDKVNVLTYIHSNLKGVQEKEELNLREDERWQNNGGSSSSEDSSSPDEEEDKKAKLPPVITTKLELVEDKERQPEPQDKQKWGLRNIIKCTDMSEALIKLAAEHSNIESFSTQ